MNEVISSVDFYTPKFNHNLKGHAKIVLNNPYRTQVIEHDNVVQSEIVAKQFRTLGKFGNSPWANSTWSNNSLWTNVFGGIFLFDRTIPVGTEYMPRGTKMIANGSYGVNNAGTPLALGSFDGVKSELGTDRLTVVYNWAQPQGCGDISSVCLTSKTGGFIGYGFSDGAQSASLKNLYNDQTYNALTSDYENGGGFVYNNHLYKLILDNTAKTVTVKKSYCQTTGMDVIERAQGEVSTTYTYNDALVGKIGAPYSISTWIYDGISKAAIAGGSNIASGDSFYVLVFDMEHETLTEYAVTNNTDETLVYGSSASKANGLCGFDGTNIYVAKNRGNLSTTIYAINVSTSVVTRSIDEVSASSDYVTTIRPITPYHNCVVKNNKECIWDTINDTVYPINTGIDTDCYCQNNDAFTNNYNLVGNNYQTYEYKNPLYLGTINNLATSATKTNEDSMTVTYTLEKV